MTATLFLLAALTPTTQADEAPTRLHSIVELEDVSADEGSQLSARDLLGRASSVLVDPPSEPDPVYADVLTTCISTDNNVTWTCVSTFIDDCSANGIDWPVLMLDIGTFQTCTGMA